MIRKKLWKSCMAWIVTLSLITGSSVLPVYAGEFSDGTLEQEEVEPILEEGEAFLSEWSDDKFDGILDGESSENQEVMLDGEDAEVFAAGEMSGDAVAGIGDTGYSTLKEAWDAAVKMTTFNGKDVSEENPVEIMVLKDCEITSTLEQLEGHIKLTSYNDICTIQRASSFAGNQNQHMIKMGGASSSSLPAKIEKERSLTLENIVLDGGKNKSENEKLTGGSIIYMYARTNKEHLILCSGAKLQNNNTSGAGGAIYVGGNKDYSKVDIYDGAVIDGNKANNGGGIYIMNQGTVNLKGGIIQNNSTSGNYTYGGGIYVSGGIFHMTGGTIQGNSCSYQGGGIYVPAGQNVRVTLEGGEIKGNTPQGVFGASDSTLYLGASIAVSDTIEFTKGSGKIILNSPVSNTFQLKYSITGEPKNGNVLVTKAEGYGDEALDKTKFSLLNTSKALKVSADGNNLVVIPATYNVSGWATSNGNNNVGVDYFDGINIPAGEVYEKKWSLLKEWAKNYAFAPYDPDSDNGMWEIGGAPGDDCRIEITSDDDYDTVTVKITGCENYLYITGYVVEKDEAPDSSVVTLDYLNGRISYDASVYEVYEEDKKSSDKALLNGADISQLISDAIAEQPVTVYVRKRRTEDSVQSRWSSVTIYPRADYTAVDEALKRVPGNLNIYTKTTRQAVIDAVNSVDRGKNSTEQAAVDAMAKAINDAVDALKIIYIPPTPKPLPDNVPDGSYWKENDIVTPDGTVIKSDGTIVLEDGTELKKDEDGINPSIDKNGTVTDTNGTVIEKDGTIILPGEDSKTTSDDTKIEKGEGTKKPSYNPENGTVTTEEGNTVTRPGGNKVTPPAGSIIQKDGTITEPDGTINAPDGTITKPDGTVITPDGTTHNTDGSIQSSDGTYLCPASPWLERAEIYVSGNQVKATLADFAAGAEGYDYVISENINCIKDKDYSAVSKNILKKETVFRYLPQGTYYVYCHAWLRGADNKKVFGPWSNYKVVTVTAVTPETPVIENVKVDGSTVTVTYTKCENAEGYDIVLGEEARKVYGEKRPVNYGSNVKKVKGQDKVTVTFRNVEKGVYYAGLHAWNRTSEDQKKVFGPWSGMKRISVK